MYHQRMSYDFIEDSSSGFLKVPIHDIEYFGIKESISPFSYIDADYCYLEEDRDIYILFDVILFKTGKDNAPIIRHVIDKKSAIRFKKNYSIQLFNNNLIALENKKAVMIGRTEIL